VEGDRLLIGAGLGLYLADIRSAAQLRSYVGHTSEINALAPSSDSRYFLSAAFDQTLRVWRLDRSEPLLSLFVAGDEWVAWTPEGYYAASPNGENLMGWQVNSGPDKMATFHPTARFRKTFYRPDVIKLLLEAGDLKAALARADAQRGRRTEQTEVARALPPKVRLLSPDHSGARLAGGSLEVRAAAEQSGDSPVTGLRLLVDGRPYGSEQPPKAMRGLETQASWNVELPPGTYRLAVKAASAASYAVSEEVEVTVGGGARTDRIKAPGRLHVLAIGINSYPGALRLDAAAPDARAVAEAFQQHSSRLFQTVDIRTLLDREATRQAMLRELDRLKGEVRPNDVAVVFYAGHGDAKRTSKFHLLPADVNLRDLAGTGVSVDELRERLQLPCSTLLILDACYSGSFGQEAPGGKRKRGLPEAADGAVRELKYDDGIVVMCGAAKDEQAAEEKGRGYFTRALVEGLSGRETRDRNGLVNVLKLQVYVRERVLELSEGEQEPTIDVRSTVRAFALARPEGP
jgi:hypothetical protein